MDMVGDQKSRRLPKEEVERLLTIRHTAKQLRDFRRADAIRDFLAAAYIRLRDGRDGTVQWSYDPLTPDLWQPPDIPDIF